MRISPRRAGRARTATFAVILAMSAVPLLWAAWFEHGVFWPDEILQTLEQGHRFAFGYGLVPWEFRDGVRSWLVPGAIGVVMKLGAFAHVHSGLGLARLVKSCIAFGTLAAAYATMRLAERFGGLLAAALAGILYGSNPLLVYFGSRCFTDTVSLPVVAFGTLLLVTARRPSRVCVAGVLFGLAVVVRTQNGLLVATAIAILLATRQWRSLGAFTVGAAAALAIGGALDWVTWGAPFASIVRYVLFNLNEGANVGWGDEPFSYYGATYFHAMGWPLFVLGLGAIVSLRRAWRVELLLVVYVAAHEAIKLKQARLLLPVFPLLIAVGAAGIVVLVRLVSKHRRRIETSIVAALSMAVVVTGAVKLHSATFASMGYLDKGATPAWHFDEAPTILFSRAGERADTCGVIYFGRSGRDWDHTGTFSYLHRNVPLFHAREATLSAYANYIVAPRGAARVPPRYEIVDSFETFALYRRPGECAPAPAGYSRDSER
jgi:phosphatidylinositol glycan class B